MKKKQCPICGETRTHIGITRKYNGSFFLIPSICTGFEIVRKCKNGHYWTKSWMYYKPKKVESNNN